MTDVDHFSDIENNIPLLGSDNAPSQLLVSDLDRLRMVCAFLHERYADKVSGLWYLNERDCDGRIQVVLRTDLKRKTDIEHIYLCADISRILGDALVYDYNDINAQKILTPDQAFAVYPQMGTRKRGRAQCLVIRGNRILMVKHRIDGEEYYILPGGGIEYGESPEEAALRELSEECNLRGTIIRKTGEFFDPYSDMHGRSGFITYLIDIGEQEPTLGFDPEFSEDEQVLKEARWMTLDELSERDRAFLWSAGLMSIPQFYEEIQNWSREVTCPKRR